MQPFFSKVQATQKYSKVCQKYVKSPHKIQSNCLKNRQKHIDASCLKPRGHIEPSQVLATRLLTPGTADFGNPGTSN